MGRCGKLFHKVAERCFDRSLACAARRTLYARGQRTHNVVATLYHVADSSGRAEILYKTFSINIILFYGNLLQIKKNKDTNISISKEQKD